MVDLQLPESTRTYYDPVPNVAPVQDRPIKVFKEKVVVMKEKTAAAVGFKKRKLNNNASRSRGPPTTEY